MTLACSAFSTRPAASSIRSPLPVFSFSSLSTAQREGWWAHPTDNLQTPHSGKLFWCSQRAGGVHRGSKRVVLDEPPCLSDDDHPGQRSCAKDESSSVTFADSARHGTRRSPGRRDGHKVFFFAHPAASVQRTLAVRLDKHTRLLWGVRQNFFPADRQRFSKRRGFASIDSRSSKKAHSREAVWCLFSHLPVNQHVTSKR